MATYIGLGLSTTSPPCQNEHGLFRCEHTKRVSHHFPWYYRLPLAFWPIFDGHDRRVEVMHLLGRWPQLLRRCCDPFGGKRIDS